MATLSTDNFAQYIIEQTEHLDKIAIKDDIRTITYSELASSIRRYATHLRNQGIKRGDRVAMCMSDSIEWTIGFLAVTLIGGSPVLISPKVISSRLADMLDNAEPNGFIYDPNEITPPVIDNIIYLPVTNIVGEYEEYNKFHKFNHDSVGMLATTSGTSGGTQQFITHRHAIFKYELPVYIKCYDVTAESIVASTPTLSFHYGTLNAILTLALGATFIMSARIPSRQQVCNLVRDNRVTHLFSTPTILANMTRGIESSSDLAGLTHMICAAEFLPNAVEEKFKEIYNKDILCGLGLGEMTSWVTYQHPTMRKFGTIGKPIPDIEIEIRREDGTICELGELGEFYLKGPHSALGYWNNWAMTKERFFGKWFKTKDMGFVDDEGFYTYVCRADDLIKVNSSFVSPNEIENAISQHDAVSECIVLSYPGISGMTEIAAKIVLIPDKTSSAGNIRKFLADKLESHKIPKIIEFVTDIPKTITAKKIRKHTIG